MYYHNHLLRAMDMEEFIYSVSVSASETISLPMFNGDDSLYDFVVDFGDGTGKKTVTAFADTDRQHTYTGAGTFDITITGTFDYIKFADSPDSIIELKSFGGAGIGSQSFLNCTNFTTLSATDIPAIHLTNLSECFRDSAIATVNVAINSWDVSTVVTMSSMFRGTATFNQGIGNWNVANVTSMNFMFDGAAVFNQDISTWNVSSVITMLAMFRSAPNFNQDISTWNTGAVTDMSFMFNGASAFDQNLGAWDITSMTTAGNMFNGITLSTVNYDSLLVGWEAQIENTNVTFDGGNSLFTKSPSAAETARSVLIATSSWTITDGGATP